MPVKVLTRLSRLLCTIIGGVKSSCREFFIAPQLVRLRFVMSLAGDQSCDSLKIVGATGLVG